MSELASGKEILRYNGNAALPLPREESQTAGAPGARGLQVLWWECGPLPVDCVSSVKQEARISIIKKWGSVGDLRKGEKI